MSNPIVPFAPSAGYGLGYGGLTTIYTNQPGQSVIGPTVVNAYSILQIPSYFRALTFKSEAMGSFERCITLKGAEAEDHYLNPILDVRPNALTNATFFWRTFFFHLFHRSNAYARIRFRSPGSRIVTAIETLWPDDVTPFRVLGDDGAAAQYYYLYSTKEVLFSYEVLHLMGTSYDGLRGMDPAWLHFDAFERARAVLQYQTRYLKNGTVMRYTIEVPGTLTDARKSALIEMVSTRFTGPNGDQDIAILTDGAKLVDHTTNARNAQLAEAERNSTIDMARITGVSPQLLYDLQDAQYNAAVDAMDDEVLRNTLRPVVEEWEAELTLKLLSPAEQAQGYEVEMDASAIIRGDVKTESAIVVTEVTAGIRTPNEARAERGLPISDDPDANKLKMLGDTTVNLPQDGQQQPPEQPSKAIPPPDDSEDYEAFRPLLEDAAKRVDTKADKAFSGKANTAKPELTVWANVFAEQQEKFCREALAPIVQAMQGMGAPTPDLDKIGANYSAAIRRRAATGEAKTLAEILAEVESGQREIQ